MDLSHFKSSNVESCNSMFYNCTNLSKINLGLLDFRLCESFEIMFYICQKLVEIDISNFKTQNCTSFKSMFENCFKLTKIDVSKFNSSKCLTISNMFKNCRTITEIDMLNFDLRNIKNTGFFREKRAIDGLFCGCIQLKLIQLNINFNEEVIRDIKVIKEIFEGVPDKILFIYRRENANDYLLKQLPLSWEIIGI